MLLESIVCSLHGNQSLIASRLYLHNLGEGSSPPSLGRTVSEKLIWENFLLLKAQIVPVVCGAQLYDFLDGSIKELSSTVTVIRDGKSEQEANLAHAAWIVQDQ
jgi:hypothetical protein